MKRKIIIAAAIALLFSACDAATASDRGADETELTKAAAATEHIAQTTKAETVPKAIPPLTPSGHQSYFLNDDFSVSAELKKLQSSLYYPDIVAQMGANPDMFAVEMSVRVKNISYDDKTFDCCALSLFSGENALYIFDGGNVEIKSGKTENINVRALCTLDQAKGISGVSFDGEKFETAELFIPQSFSEVIEVQSADDVRTYLYKKFYYRADEDNYMFSFSEPASICAHILGRVGDNGEYLAVKYSVTNRSDYALIIDPNSYLLHITYDNDGSGENAEMAFVSADEELMYEPQEAGRLKDIGTLYEVPDFICMIPDKCTEFTVIYKAEGHIIRWRMMCSGHDEPYYARYKSIYEDDCDY